ncbi:MAG: DDE-type integrase/transposase/recombinase [Candidatus Poribacteria bacterium]|nr:DDE-type integrase/transposase/recombinase [Candidatus Poribacteria bacterium]
MLLRMEYTVRYRRVARLMKSANLSVSIKHACQTTQSVDCPWQWGNRLDHLDICRRNQVWVADVTYVRLKGHFVYVSVLMDVFTRMISGWQLSRHLTQPLTLKIETLTAGTTAKCS